MPSLSGYQQWQKNWIFIYQDTSKNVCMSSNKYSVTSDVNKHWNVFESCSRAYKYQIYENAKPAHLILPDFIALTTLQVSEKHKWLGSLWAIYSSHVCYFVSTNSTSIQNNRSKYIFRHLPSIFMQSFCSCTQLNLFLCYICKLLFLWISWYGITFISRLMHSNIQNLEVKIYVV